MRLRSLGDFSLFMSGFFPDSLRRRTVDVDYYVSMGEYAYGSLSRRDEDTFAEVFAELARKFVGYMDVLADVSERTAVTSSADLLRLYEKWLRTGSSRDGREARRSRDRSQRLDRQAFHSVNVSAARSRAGRCDSHGLAESRCPRLAAVARRERVTGPLAAIRL